MLSVEEALEQVFSQARPRPGVACPTADVLGLVLAEDVTSDVDSPPHDKSLVDGYAVRSGDLAGGPAELEILEEVTAGAVPTHAVTPGRTTQIMTGAPLPEGADAVVMIEQSALVGPAHPVPRVRITTDKVVAGQNIMRRAASMTRGQRVLTRGVRLRSVEIGILAEVGRARVSVVPRPTVAVIPTGNELVGVGQTPQPGQIRNSNGALLVAAAQAAGAAAIDLGIARDERKPLRELITRGLAADVLVISGGVSAGVLDLVPAVLAEVGVRQVFHKVNLKPGKPLWFGIFPGESGDKLVFGLPGNPVSSFVCFELFVRPAIGRLAGRLDASLVEVTAELTSGFSHRGDRPTYHPARLDDAGGRLRIEPLHWQGSGDLRTLVDANALVCFAAGERQYQAGEPVPALRL